MSRLILLLLAVTALGAVEQPLTFVDKGVSVPCGGDLGTFTITWPTLVPDSDGDQKIAPQSHKVTGRTAKLIYPGDVAMTMTLTRTSIEMSFASAPAGTKALRVEMMMPATLRSGSEWTFGDLKGTLPAEKPSAPHLFQGNQTDFTFTKGRRSLALTMPAFSYQQLTDLREWKWDALTWVGIAPLGKDHLQRSITVIRK